MRNHLPAGPTAWSRAPRRIALLALACGCTRPSAPAAPAPGPPRPVAGLIPAAKPAVAERAAADAPFLSPLETAVVAEMNIARTNPRRYAAVIESTLAWYEGTLLHRPGEVPVRTREGALAAREAVRVLRATKPVAALAPSRGLSLAARDLVRDQGGRGTTGHTATDGSGPADRVGRYGRWDTSLSENIAYGPRTARDVVVQLLVDDDVPDRGHRKNILDPTARLAGVACGEHAIYDRMCVIDHAGDYSDRP